MESQINFATVSLLQKHRIMSKLVRMSSDNDIEVSYDEVPEHKDFQFKIKENEKEKELAYTLKMGKKLPYNFSYDGMNMDIRIT